jgi:hypothetical protein
MRTQVEITDEATPVVRRRLRELPQRRRVALDGTAREILGEIARRNPVETGRSRAAWETAMSVLSGTRAQVDLADVTVRRQEREKQGEITVSNQVEYVPFLEYGTRRMRPFAMVRGALARARQAVLRHFAGLLGR